MREYSQVRGRFWTGPTGRRIRTKGKPAQVLAMYLFTGPSMNMIGLYYLPIVTICHETGFTPDEVEATLKDLADADFAYYDEDLELVWIPTAARYQIGDELHGGDKRIKGVKRMLQPYLRHRFGREFLARYKEAFSLHINDDAKPLQGPSKPGTGDRTGTGAGEGTDPPPQTPPPNRAKGLPRENAEADPWALPPGLTSEAPSGSGNVPTVAGTPLRRALERLIAGEAAQGREVGEAMRKKLRKRLAGGALEQNLADELKASFEKRHTTDTEARQWDAALDWIDTHGGKAAVLKDALAWLSTNHGNGDDLQLSVRRWEQQAHAPPKVSSAILPDVSLAYQRAPRAARGG